jgi:hypothetical protein
MVQNVLLHCPFRQNGMYQILEWDRALFTPLLKIACNGKYNGRGPIRPPVHLCPGSKEHFP